MEKNKTKDIEEMKENFLNKLGLKEKYGATMLNDILETQRKEMEKEVRREIRKMPAFKALQDYHQADEDGVMVLVS